MNMPRKIAEVGETDAFVLATEWKMRRSGQGGHFGCSVLELSSPPDATALRAGLDELLRRHPMLVAASGRPWPFTTPWYVRPRNAAESLPLVRWRLPGPLPDDAAADGKEISSLETLVDWLLNEASATFLRPARHNMRVDLLDGGAGGCWLIVTWSHAILDGVGAELLLRELANLCHDSKADSVAPSFVAPARSPWSKPYDRWQATWPMLEHLQGLLQQGIHSLAGPKPKASRMRARWERLDEVATAAIQERATRFCGPLIQTHFHLACAIIAHDAVWRRHRGGSAPVYTVALPVQLRARGKAPPIFRNNVSVMFFTAKPDELSDIGALTASLVRQQQDAMKKGLMASFSEMQRWMRLLPAPLYSFFLDSQMKGQNTAFHHSHTGPFAKELGAIAGAAIRDGWHVPGLFAPPGTGLFMSQRDGRATLVMSWRECALAEAEAATLLNAFRQALRGEMETRE
jgi:hypothetical protein